MSKELIKMQASVWSQRKNMFHLKRKPSGVLSGVWFGIKIHPADPNGHNWWVWE